jgi:hypothetical protein
MGEHDDGAGSEIDGSHKGSTGTSPTLLPSEWLGRARLRRFGRGENADLVGQTDPIAPKDFSTNSIWETEKVQ